MATSNEPYDFWLPRMRTVRASGHSSTKVKLVRALVGMFEFEEWKDFDSEALKTWNKLKEIVREEELKEAKTLHNSLSAMMQHPKITSQALNRIPEDTYKGYVQGHGRFAKRAYQRSSGVAFPDETSATGLFSTSFATVNALLQRLIGTNLFRIMTKYLKSEILTASSRKIETVGGEPVRSKKTADAQLLPDYSLTRMSNDRGISGDWICSFEVKGPQKNITGRQGEVTEGKAPRRDVDVEEEDIVAIPDYSVQDSSGELAKRLQFLFSELTDPTPDLALHQEGRMEHDPSSPGTAFRQEIEGSSSGISARHTNPQQASAHVSVSRTTLDDVSPNVAAQKPVSQALSYALETASGCSFLWNFGDGIAMEVTKMKNKKKAKVRVALVRENRGDPIGHIAKMLYFCEHAINRATDEKADIESGLKEIRALAVDRLVDESKRKGGKKRKRDNGGSAGGAEVVREGQGEGGRKRNDKAPRTEESRLADSSNGLEDGGGVEGEDRSHSNNDNVCKIQSSGFVEPSQETAAAGSAKADDTSDSVDSGLLISKSAIPAELKLPKRAEDHLDAVVSPWGSTNLSGSYEEVRGLITGSEGIFDSGMSGNIFLCNWEGVKVAVKAWNNEREEGLEDIETEIETYLWLKEHAPEVLGTAVPTFYFYWNFLNDDIATAEKIGIVTEFVGNKVVYVGCGELEVEEPNGNFRVHGSDLHALRDAALLSLDALHKVGLMHGDMRFDNIRAIRCPGNGNGQVTSEARTAYHTWRVWWIDLGQSTLVSEKQEYLFGWEKKLCRALFFSTVTSATQR